MPQPAATESAATIMSQTMQQSANAGLQNYAMAADTKGEQKQAHVTTGNALTACNHKAAPASTQHGIS